MLFTVGLLALASATAPVKPRHDYVSRQVTFTEINLDWFGLNRSPSGKSEPRVQSIKSYLSDHALLGDVLVFEEIVDLDLLTSEVLDDAYVCHSYERTDPKHQHVVICVSGDYRLDVAPDSDDYALEEVDVTGHLRPAVHGILKTADGQTLAHVFGVHLKASPDGDATRKKQVKALEAYLEEQSDPVIVMGDFNTYDDDPATFSRTFAGSGLAELDLPEDYTWASADGQFDPAKFDRIWITRGLIDDVAKDDVVGPCNGEDEDALARYNESVSDHCATTVTVTL